MTIAGDLGRKAIKQNKNKCFLEDIDTKITQNVRLDQISFRCQMVYLLFSKILSCNISYFIISALRTGFGLYSVTSWSLLMLFFSCITSTRGQYYTSPIHINRKLCITYKLNGNR